MTPLRRTILTALLFALSVSTFAIPSSAGTATGVGFMAIDIPDPVNGGHMPGVVFYPSAEATGETVLGPYRLEAIEGADPISGSKPLVVISHGHGGSDLGHHDLAEYLARHGFIVAALTHPKDNFRDISGAQDATVLVGRPIEVSATINFLLHDRRWSALIDPKRIGVAGFSAGGYTALMMVGATPRFSRILDYCAAHPRDQGVCGGERKLATKNSKTGTTLRQVARQLQASLDRWGPAADPRVKAAFVMAPFSIPFGAQGAAHIDRPVFLYYAQDDHVLQPAFNALAIAPHIRTLAGRTMIPRSGHYVFLAPCTAELAAEATELCQDPPGIDRVAIHRQINSDALKFFEKMLR